MDLQRQSARFADTVAQFITRSDLYWLAYTQYLALLRSIEHHTGQDARHSYDSQTVPHIIRAIEDWPELSDKDVMGSLLRQQVALWDYYLRRSIESDVLRHQIWASAHKMADYMLRLPGPAAADAWITSTKDILGELLQVSGQS